MAGQSTTACLVEQVLQLMSSSPGNTIIHAYSYPAEKCPTGIQSLPAASCQGRQGPAKAQSRQSYVRTTVCSGVHHGVMQSLRNRQVVKKVRTSSSKLSSEDSATPVPYDSKKSPPNRPVLSSSSACHTPHEQKNCTYSKYW